MTEGRRLPKVVQTFEEIINGGYVYVDKTDYVWLVANNDNKHNFLARPRRFGKSLFTDTLKCYFEGRKDLFKGLKIMKKKNDWVKRPVFYFNFAGKNTAADLLDHLEVTMGLYEKEYGSSDFKNLEDRMRALMENAYKKTGVQVAVLVDEYDTPLQHTLFNNDEHEKLKDVYRSFFPSMKSGDSFLKCLFLTGVTKFTQLSIFSTLNSVTILGYRSEYATALGFTEQEIIDNFAPEISSIASAKGCTTEQVVSQLRDMYDGYHFCGDTSKAVYNPFSVINAFSDQSLRNYWIASGSSALLSGLLQRNDLKSDNLEGAVVAGDTLRSSDVSLTNKPLFLFQTGYLTIKDYDEDDDFYTLGFPNKEVRAAFYQIVLPYAVDKESEEVDNSILRIKRALRSGDIPAVYDNMTELVSSSPYVRKGGISDYEILDSH